MLYTALLMITSVKLSNAASTFLVVVHGSIVMAASVVDLYDFQSPLEGAGAICGSPLISQIIGR